MHKKLLINVLKIILLCLFVFMILKIIMSLIRNIKGEYIEVINVRNKKDLIKHFVLDNPFGNGVDPTGGLVDYSYMFPRDSDGQIKKNVNGDTTWNDIPLDAELINDYDNGVYIGLDKSVKNGVVGAPRLMSRKLYRGGLFIFDVEHCPVGCTVWPALWLNGFVGENDQYHAKKGTKIYNEGLKQLSKSTLTDEKYKTCSDKTVLTASGQMPKPDTHLSEYVGKDVFVAQWPTGGEIDVLEQTNFSPTNLVSIHGGPSCEVVNGYDNDYSISINKMDPDYKYSNVRSVCGETWSGFGPYSGCKDDNNKIGQEGGNSSVVQNGESRYNCPKNAATSAGNSQVVVPVGSFGEPFNFNGGGVYALEWTPQEIINVWWFPRLNFSSDLLEKNGMPLSENPDPKKWDEEMLPDVKNSPGYYKKQKVLVASYILNNKDALTKGCDINYQGIIINITVGGGWGGAVMPSYCKVDGDKPDANTYIKTCFNANSKNALKNDGIDPNSKCYDGGLSSKYRGSHAKPLFYEEAYFKLRQIRVLQKRGDSNIW